jgi:hypothetical protein
VMTQKRLSSCPYGVIALGPGGVSMTVREICRCVCASGPEGAVAVGTPTERSGARSHAVGRMPRCPEWIEEGKSAKNPSKAQPGTVSEANSSEVCQRIWFSHCSAPAMG